MSLFQVRWEIAFESAEARADALLESGKAEWSVYEDIVLRRAWLVGLFMDRSIAISALAELKPLLPGSPSVEPEVRELADAEWRDSYKQHFHAWQFDRLHWIPVWERPTRIVPAGHKVLWLDPGMAFGTGNHETTRLCAERLVNYAASGGTDRAVIDAGCGSGILALSAARLGFRSVFGFDNDPEAIRVSLDNAALNDLEAAAEFTTAELNTGLMGRRADIVMANILAPVLIEWRRALAGSLLPGGALILSGILASEAAEVRRAYAAETRGWTCESRVLGEWSDVVFLRPA